MSPRVDSRLRLALSGLLSVGGGACVGAAPPEDPSRTAGAASVAIAAPAPLGPKAPDAVLPVAAPAPSDVLSSEVGAAGDLARLVARTCACGGEAACLQEAKGVAAAWVGEHGTSGGVGYDRFNALRTRLAACNRDVDSVFATELAGLAPALPARAGAAASDEIGDLAVADLPRLKDKSCRCSGNKVCVEQAKRMASTWVAKYKDVRGGDHERAATLMRELFDCNWDVGAWLGQEAAAASQ